uniref:UBA domain-containing protein n=1 Tax=Hanusia phi TaxID=3032 RepID=A0A7S0DXC6_9CRYP
MGLSAIATITCSAIKAGKLLELDGEGLLVRRQVWRVITYQFFFSTASELIIGMVLMYTFRQFERHWGSKKFGAFIVVAKTLSAIMGTGALFLQRSWRQNFVMQVASGPYGLIFASLVQYYFEIPVSQPMQIFGLNFSNKTFVYIFAMQLSCSLSRPSQLAAASGILTGIMYRWNVLGLRKYMLPSWIYHLSSALFLPFLDAPVDVAARPLARPRAQQRRADSGAHQQTGEHGLLQRQAARAPELRRNDAAAIANLANMGFHDVERNQRLLDRYNGDVNRVVEELIGS